MYATALQATFLVSVGLLIGERIFGESKYLEALSRCGYVAMGAFATALFAGWQ